MDINIYTRKIKDIIDKKKEIKNKISEVIKKHSGLEIDTKYIELNENTITLNIFSLEKFSIYFYVENINKDLEKIGYSIKKL